MSGTKAPEPDPKDKLSGYTEEELNELANANRRRYMRDYYARRELQAREREQAGEYDEAI